MAYELHEGNYVYIPKHWMSFGTEDLTWKKKRLLDEIKNELAIGKYQRKQMLKQVYWINDRLPKVKTIELLGGKIE